jgi:hypothetical protein
VSHEAAPPLSVGDQVKRARAQDAPAARGWAKRVPVLVLALLAVFIAAERLWSYGKPVGRDVSLYAVMGHELLAGRPLYSDLLEQRPPATMVSYAAAEYVVGYGRQTVYTINVVVALITLLGVYSAGAAA